MYNWSSTFVTFFYIDVCVLHVCLALCNCQWYVCPKPLVLSLYDSYMNTSRPLYGSYTYTLRPLHGSYTTSHVRYTSATRIHVRILRPLYMTVTRMFRVFHLTVTRMFRVLYLTVTRMFRVLYLTDTRMFRVFAVWHFCFMSPGDTLLLFCIFCSI